MFLKLTSKSSRAYRQTGHGVAPIRSGTFTGPRIAALCGRPPSDDHQLAAPAPAADLYTKAPPPAAPPPPPIYDWSGFYIGANGGWGQSHNCLDLVTDVFGTVTGCNDRSGGVVGGQIGYRWQTNQFVAGLEAQGDWADLSNTRVSVFDPFLSTTLKTDAIGLFTGQVGWAWNNSLLYFKGGAAVTRNRLDIFDNTFGTGLFSASNTRWGGTGLGVWLRPGLVGRC